MRSSVCGASGAVCSTSIALGCANMRTRRHTNTRPPRPLSLGAQPAGRRARPHELSYMRWHTFSLSRPKRNRRARSRQRPLSTPILEPPTVRWHRPGVYATAGRRHADVSPGLIRAVRLCANCAVNQRDHVEVDIYRAPTYAFDFASVFARTVVLVVRDVCA